MKPAMLCLLLLAGCDPLAFPEQPPSMDEYALTWSCQSPEGCERMGEVARIDRVTRTGDDFHFTSTQDVVFFRGRGADFLGHVAAELLMVVLPVTVRPRAERSRLCRTPGGYELDLAIPNQNPTTYSLWLVEARDLSL